MDPQGLSLVVVFDGIINVMALLMFDYYYCVIGIIRIYCTVIYCFIWLIIYINKTPVPHLGFTAVVAESGPM